jgi:uncharacterized SAM-binding protein YcdF (DUF218 family)
VLVRAVEGWLGRARTATRAEAVVVLGAAVRRGRPSRFLAERLRAAAGAWHAGAAPWVVVTGAGEAEVMRRELVRLGVAEAAILVEDRARSTRDNARFCGALLGARGVSRVLVATQAFHRRRSVAAFRRQGVEASALVFAGSPVPAAGILRELAAVVVYRLFGWI